MKYFALLTKLGENLLAQATALGTKIELTQMAVGDGGGKLPTPDTNQTKLIAEKRRAAINTLFIDDKNKNQIIAEQIIPEAEGGWWIREIGLFDKTGNLIAVANCPETYKPQLAEGSGRTQAIRMILVVSHTESVTLKIDPSVVLATRKYVDDLITALDIKLQKQIDNKVNKAGDNVTGTLKFNSIAPLTHDIESLSLNKDEIANYLRKFRYLYNSTIFHEIVTKDGIQIATGTVPKNLIYSLSPNGSISVSGRIIPSDFLDFNQRYLGINNPAIAAKKLDKPSRIAGHTFQGQGEDIKITPADIGAQPVGSYAPAGDYATNSALKNGLDGKFDKTGGAINGNVSAKGTVASSGGVIVAHVSDGVSAQLDATGSIAKIRSRNAAGKWFDHVIPESAGTLLQVNDYGIGNPTPLIGALNISLSSIVRAGSFIQQYSVEATLEKEYPYAGLAGTLINYPSAGAKTLQEYRVYNRPQFTYYRSVNTNGSSKGEPWVTQYNSGNTKTDRNGNLKVSNASDALSDYPVGSPIPWPQATAPTGFLVCNGQVFNKTTYPLLATAYPSGKLPDLRGEFIRGLDAGRSIDSGRAVLSTQSDENKEHTHSIALKDGNGNGTNNQTAMRTLATNVYNSTYTTEKSGGKESRPRNIAFLYIVRAA